MLGIPLYIGVEVILGIAILNKASGIYGLLSLLTGHPLSFSQWLYNILSLLAIPVYILGLMNISRQPQVVRKMALTAVVYIADSIIGLFYTVLFAFAWFSGDAQLAPPLPQSKASIQLASPERESFFTTLTIVVLLALRVYTTLVIISFSRQLLRKQREEGVSDHDQEIQENASMVDRAMYALETRAKRTCAAWFM